MSGGQISYDLRRLRAHQIIERIPHSRNYQLTADGLSTALFFTRLTRRVIIPALAEITGPARRPAARSARPTAPTRQPSPTSPARPHSASSHIGHQAPLTSGTSRNTQPKLTRPEKSLRGKMSYAADLYVTYGRGDRQFSLVIHIVGAPGLWI